MFPFLSKTLIPEQVNHYTLNVLLADTGSAQSGHLGQLIPFVFFAGMRQGAPGFWDFFGPIVLALAPLWIATFGSFHKWRVPAVVWCAPPIPSFYISDLPPFPPPRFPSPL